VEALVGHRFFTPHVTPVQLFNRATDPMLPAAKPHTFAVVGLLDARRLTNHLLIITRWRVDPADCAVLNAARHLKVTLLVTHSNIQDARVEPVDSCVARRSLRTAYAHAGQYRVVLYWRPIVPGLNDAPADLARAADLSRSAHATVFTGLFYREQIRAYYRETGLPEPYPDVARRKILPAELERGVLEYFVAHAPGTPPFRKTTCAVSYTHGLADFNGHYGIPELCDICPAAQVGRRTAAFSRPGEASVATLAGQMGAAAAHVTDRAVITMGLDEQRRYWMQHQLGYQVHDSRLPHHLRRHGRAETGWAGDEAGEETE
jgi:hypothetical protein